MKRYRLGAWIGQESYLDKKTGKRRTCESWTVKYQAFGREKGDYRQCAERGFGSEEEAIKWWRVQKEKMSPAALATCEKHVRLRIKPAVGQVLLCDLERSPQLIEQAQTSWLTADRKDGREGTVSPGFVRSLRVAD